MLNSLRRLGAARLHLLTEHGRLQALLDTTLARIPPSISSSAFIPCISRFYGTLGADSFGDEFSSVELTLPDDLNVIASLNPELRDVILAHQEYARSKQQEPLRGRLQELLSKAVPTKAAMPNITKTSLLKLRVDQLRSELEKENADTRGTKDVLVQRLMTLVQERQQQMGELMPAMGDFKEGIVTRRQVAQQAKLAERHAQHHTTYGISEQELRVTQAQRTVEKTEFATVFQPEQLAEMLLDARADDVCIIDVRRRCPFTDYMVLGTVRSQRMVRMLAAGVLHQLKERCREVAPGVTPTIEGSKDDSDWMVVDAGSVVVHIFQEGWREEYDLEGLWGDAGGKNLRYLKPKSTVQTLDTIQ